MTSYTINEYNTKCMIDNISHYIKSKYNITLDEFYKLVNNHRGEVITVIESPKDIDIKSRVIPSEDIAVIEEKIFDKIWLL